MPLSLKKILLVALPLAVLPIGWSANTQISSEKPVINFRLPMFTEDGHRAWLARGSEARFVKRDQVDITELTLTIFSKEVEGKVNTMILSPIATILPQENVATGPKTIRVIDDEFEATGEDWRYSHKEQNIKIKKNVRVKFNAELKNLLQ
jgi:lipopolysaccharide export system protein LptC